MEDKILVRKADETFSVTGTPAPREVAIILAGDVMLGRTVMIKSLDSNDPAYPFEKIADELRRADLVFVNLESPVVSDCPRISEGFSFCADPKMAEGLVVAGVDVVSLANNHAGNFGTKGIDETVRILKENGIDTTGLGNLIIKKEGESEFGFLGFDFVSKVPRGSDFELIKDSDGKVDVLIVGVHWGEEYTSNPTNSQKEIAKNLVDAGADVVVGHHPHWVQGVGNIDGHPVYYSLGNLVFDQMWSEETKKGMVVELTFRDGELISDGKLPTYMSSWAQPEFVKVE